MLIFVSLLYVIWKMLATEQRISVLSWRLNGLPFAEVQELFRRSYRTEAPTRTTIRGLVNKLQRTGNVCDEKRSARSSTSQETVETIWQAIEQSLKASTHRLRREHGIPTSFVWQILRFVLKNKAYHIQVLGLIQQRIYGPLLLLLLLLCWSNNHVNIAPGHVWAILAAPIVCRQHSVFGGVSTGRRPTALCAHCA